MSLVEGVAETLPGAAGGVTSPLGRKALATFAADSLPDVSTAVTR